MNRTFIALVSFIALNSAQALAAGLCVNKDMTALRDAPSSDANITWKVPKYMPLKPTGKASGNWIESIDVDGEKHWVKKQDVSSKLNCIVVRVGQATLRTGPGDKFGRAPSGFADRYSTFLDHGGEDGWTQITSVSGEKSWISMDTIWKPSVTMKMKFEDP